ncbi:hypothetical protein [Limosilactobacillus caviae]|uniref:hypothetical protein n=1 Tax=Limosilactobacillus caviae TaxID=1769424 RepID=UPI003513B1BC
MKTFLIILFLVICISFWAFLYPNAKITLKATSIKKTSYFIYRKLQIWGNNRIQERRIAKSLVEYDQLFSYAPNYDLEKAFSKTKAFNHKGKKLIIIPTRTQALSKLAKEQLDNLSLPMLNEYYPNVHWNLAELKKFPYINYFLVIVTEK